MIPAVVIIFSFRHSWLQRTGVRCFLVSWIVIRIGYLTGKLALNNAYAPVTPRNGQRKSDLMFWVIPKVILVQMHGLVLFF